MIKALTPTLHKSVPMGVRVKVPKEYLGEEAFGVVAGIASINVVFQYIVVLDRPFENAYGVQQALVAVGPQLESEDGKTNWRFTSDEERLNWLRANELMAKAGL